MVQFEFKNTQEMEISKNKIQTLPLYFESMGSLFQLVPYLLYYMPLFVLLSTWLIISMTDIHTASSTFSKSSIFTTSQWDRQSRYNISPIQTPDPIKSPPQSHLAWTNLKKDPRLQMSSPGILCTRSNLELKLVCITFCTKYPSSGISTQPPVVLLEKDHEAIGAMMGL